MDNILGVKVDKYSINEILEKVKLAVESNKKLQIVTLNTELLVASNDEKKLQNIINSSLVVPESSGLYLADNYLASERKAPIRWVSALFQTVSGQRKNLKPRIAGVDLCYFIAGLASEFGYKLVLLGGREEVATAAAQRLNALYPKLKVSGMYGGKIGLDDKKILLELEKEKPDILFVAFGQPTQEFWIAENLDNLPAKVALGVGGTLDFMAGRVVRAPLLMRTLGLEWIFRLARQPWRVKRQLALVKFVVLLLKSKMPSTPR
jgi:N-acetylglucosaminyldiphosphoundecaprenol N-acetyl-beta-D-mannosaminyltransferase